jgi:hypothetical protein
VPTTDEPDAEPPRWRSANFIAVSDGRIVFKARTADMNQTNEYINSVDGIYLAVPFNYERIKAVAETGMDGGYIDPDIPNAFRATLPIIGLGLERDGFRGNMLAITLTMGNEEFSWGGIYVADVSGRTVPLTGAMKTAK